ncbi:MAG: tetratricopeptide repeat protein [Acidobacteriota bacterium]
MNPGTRPLPALRLPSLFVQRFAVGAGDLPSATEIVDGDRSLALGEHLLAVLPGAGAAPVEVAHGLATRFGGAGAAMLFPGHVVVAPNEEGEAQHEGLLADLAETRPRLEAGEVALTGWCAAWVRGGWELASRRPYSAASGRRVPLLRAVRPRLGERGADPEARPWRSDEILGRRPAVARPAVDDEIGARLADGRILVLGALGGGKTRALWTRLGAAPRLYLDCDRLERSSSSPLEPAIDAATLGLALRRRLAAWSGNGSPGHGVDGPYAVGQLIDRLRTAAATAGAVPWLVVDAAERLDEDAIALLAALAAPDVPCRVAVIGRAGGGRAGARLDELSSVLPRVVVPPMEPAEGDALARALTDGFELPEALLERLVSASAGRPFDLEEIVLRLVHRGLVRRVYGSFFYAGDPDIEVEASWRQSYLVEDELRRFADEGLDPLPLRVVAAAGEPIESAHVARTCARFGLTLGVGWHEPWMHAGWLRRAEGGVELAGTARAAALHANLTADAVRSLRHALGGVLAHGDHPAGWQAYRLLAGTPEAVPSLLELGRGGGDDISNEEMFNALWQEYREHRARYGDEATELEILWMLLPLARRLGCLGRLQTELRRAVEISRGHEARHVALVALAAELDQEKGRFREAERGLRAALAESTGFNPQRRATLFVRLGALLHREERWQEAREIFRALLGVAEAEVPTPIGATCRFYLGNIALQERRLDEAESLHAEAARIRGELSLTRAHGTSLCALGAVALALGDYPNALERYREAEESLRKADVGADEWTFATLGIGKALSRLGDVTTAAKELRRVLDARRGRDDIVAEAIARIELARNHLRRGGVESALDEARRACFALRLAPEIGLLGDAERLLARVLLRQGALDEAREHLQEALRIHGRHDDRPAIAEDRGVALELALVADDLDAIDLQALELERALDGLRHPATGEVLFYLLFRAHGRLAEAERPLREPLPFLRRSYQELLRKTSFLDAAMRHPFLFQIETHRDIIEEAAAHHLSMPDLPLPPRE